MVLPTLILASSPANAADNTFTNGTSDNNWFTPANWSLTAPPTTADFAFIAGGPAGQTANINFPGATAARVLLQADNNLVVGADGTLSVVGTGTDGLLSVGQLGSGSPTQNSTLTIQAGGSVSAARFFIGDGTPNSTQAGIAIVTGVGSALTVDGANYNFVVGGTGSASLLRIDSGAIVNAATLGNGIVQVGLPGFGGNGTLQIGNGGISGTLNASAIVLNSNSRVLFDQTDNISFAPQVSGTGRLQKEGTGSVTLSNNSAYTGTTTISGGTLALSNNGAIAQSSGVDVGTGATFDIAGVAGAGASIVTLSGAGGVNLGGKTLTVTNGSTTYAGNATGAGGLTVSGGTLTLTGANTYIGATTISGGTLALSGAGTIAQSSGVAVGGTFDISGVNPAGASIATLSGAGGVNLGTNTLTITNGLTTYTGIATGAGGLTVSNGTLTLTGANTYTGATTISGGTLQIGDGTAGGDAGRIGQDAAGTVFSTVATTGGILAFNRTNAANYTFGGTITGSGIVNQIGTGTTTLTGTNSAGNGQFTGTANVTAGTLAVNGVFGDTANSTATINVNTAGTLHGSGTIAGSVVVGSGGTVSAGNSPGTMTVTNYTANTGSDTLFELNQANVTGGANNDLINVTNTLTVNTDSLLTLGTTGGATAPPAGVYRIFTYGTLVGGPSDFTTTVAGGGTADVYTLNSGINVRVFGAGQITQYWDGTDTGFIAGAQGGTATWNAASANWVDDPAAGTANDRWRGQAGVFGNGTTNTATAAATVTVVGARDFQSLRFSDNNYTLAAGAGGTLNATGNPFAAVAADQAFSSVTVDGGNTAALNLPITSTSGTFGLLKLGTGTLNLGGANTYTGGTRIDAGNLAILAGASVASDVTNNNAGTFTNLGTVNANVTNAGTGSNANEITGGVGNSGTFTNSGIIGGQVSNSGGFTNSGTVSGGLSNTGGSYTQTAGATNGGTTNTATIAATGGAFGGAIGNNAGGAFNVGGAVTANSTFTNGGNATLSVDAGSLAGITVLTNDSTAAAGVATAAGATLSAGGLAGTTATATVANAGTLNLVGGVGNTDYAGLITGAGALNKSGTGVQTLTGANTTGAQYTGAAAITGGTLQINGTFGNTANPPVGATATLAIGAAGTLVGTGTFAGDVTNSGTVAAGVFPGLGPVGGLTIGRDYTIQAGSTNAFDLGTPNVVNGPTNDLITVGRNLTVNGGTLALQNVNASGLYRLYDVGGTITSAANPNAGFTSVTVSNGTAAVYTIPGAGAPAPSQLNARVSVGGQIVQYWDGSDTTGRQAGTTGTPGARGGAGTWVAGSANWTDDPAAGEVNQTWQGQFGVFAAPGGAVRIVGTQGVQGLQFSANGYVLSTQAGDNGVINLVGDPVSGPAASLIRVDAGITAEIAAPITGLGLNKNVGGGTLILSGTNTFGALNIAQGTVEVRNGAAILDTAPVTIDNVAGARLLVTNSETIGSLAGGGAAGGTVAIAAGQVLTTGADNSSTTFAGVIGGAGGLAKTGTGTFTLSAANTFTGGTLNQAGTLVLAAG
ncbi:beta strand repeat-containing protein, partial [Methylobacterium segetis]|uniref:beta strand repeat-containing protein n=1 Tax=Methylobacterium segetis TaxID=2488750 RepID=UPI001A9FDBF5